MERVLPVCVFWGGRNIPAGDLGGGDLDVHGAHEVRWLRALAALCVKGLSIFPRGSGTEGGDGPGVVKAVWV